MDASSVVDASKRKATTLSIDGDVMEIRPLGAGQEVGRSCVIIKYKGKTVMLDCGIHPAYPGLNGLPFFDECEPSTIDLLLVSHFHLDHAAALPYFLSKTDFNGKVYMTHPTKAIYKMLLTDYLKVSNIAIQNLLYDEQSIAQSMNRIEVMNYHQELECSGIRFWCYNAGHVLGAAMFMLEIAGTRILYTGDFSRQEDRHLMSAELPPKALKPDVLIVESTYGVQIHENREAREGRFTGLVNSIVSRGGRCLIPSFALGRAQELLLILDEYWDAHPELQQVPIFYASSLAKRCMSVYQTYIHMMNEKIRAQITISNPFNFKYITPMKNLESFHDSGPSVVMASPGMLQSGLSRDLLERWATDKKNGCIIPGYVVEGTLAKEILNSPPDFLSSTGLRVPLNLSVEYISFSAHSDFKQTSEFVDQLEPPYVVLVHGDANEMGRLKQALLHRYEGRVQVLSPKTGQAVELTFRADKMAKTLGRLAETPPAPDTQIGGILVRRNFNHLLVAPRDLHTYTQLPTSTIVQRLQVPFRRPFSDAVAALAQVYTQIEDVPTTAVGKDVIPPVRVAGLLTITPGTTAEGQALQLEWASDPFGDMLADSVLAMLLQLDVSPVTLKAKREPKIEPGVDVALQRRLRTYQESLEQVFGTVKASDEKPQLILSVDGESATVDAASKEVTCTNATLKNKVEKVLKRLEFTN